MAELPPGTTEAASALVQYGALGVISLIAVAAVGALIWRAFQKADQSEKDCQKRDAERCKEIAELRREMERQREHGEQRLHDSIENLAHIAKAIGRQAADRQEETDKILFRPGR